MKPSAEQFLREKYKLVDFQDLTVNGKSWLELMEEYYHYVNKNLPCTVIACDKKAEYRHTSLEKNGNKWDGHFCEEHMINHLKYSERQVEVKKI